MLSGACGRGPVVYVVNQFWTFRVFWQESVRLLLLTLCGPDEAVQAGDGELRDHRIKGEGLVNSAERFGSCFPGDDDVDQHATDDQ